MKKIVALLLIAVLLFANCYATVVEVNIGGIQVNSLNDGKVHTILLEEIPFVNESGRTMVPVRAITESFGAEVSWDGNTNTVTIQRGEDKIALTIDKTTALLNGEEITLDSAPVIKAGRTFVPLRFIGEAFGYNIRYVAATNQVIIDDTKVVFKVGDTIFTMADAEAFRDIYYQVNYDKAKASGATDEEIMQAALFAALETGIQYTALRGHFPGASLDENDKKNINDSIEHDKAYIAVPLDSVSALCHEMLYYSNGIPAIYSIAKSEEVYKLYTDNYIRAKHILVDDEETANEVLSKIASGADFDALVKEYGKDPGMEANKDGYVFTHGEMVKEFEEASFALAEGEISLPVKSQFGYHIIKREALGTIPENVALMYAESIYNSKLEGVKTPEILVTNEELLELMK